MHDRAFSYFRFLRFIKRSLRDMGVYRKLQGQATPATEFSDRRNA